jgi:hypothetical protein
MSDSTYNVFQHYGTHAERLAFTPSPAAGIKPIYLWYETDTSKLFLYHTTWTEIVVGSSSSIGNVVGPGSAITDAIPLFDGTTGKLIKDSTKTIAVLTSDISSSIIPIDLPTEVTGIIPSANLPPRTGSISLIIDGGSAVITTGLKGYLEIPFACTIQAVTLLADQTGSIVIDIWKDTYVNYPPVVGDTITAAAKPTITTAIKSQDTTLTGWTTAITAGDILAFNVNSAAVVTKVTLSLKIQVP